MEPSFVSIWILERTHLFHEQVTFFKFRNLFKPEQHVGAYTTTTAPQATGEEEARRLVVVAISATCKVDLTSKAAGPRPRHLRPMTCGAAQAGQWP